LNAQVGLALLDVLCFALGLAAFAVPSCAGEVCRGTSALVGLWRAGGFNEVRHPRPHALCEGLGARGVPLLHNIPRFFGARCSEPLRACVCLLLCCAPQQVVSENGQERVVEHLSGLLHELRAFYAQRFAIAACDCAVLPVGAAFGAVPTRCWPFVAGWRRLASAPLLITHTPEPTSVLANQNQNQTFAYTTVNRELLYVCTKLHNNKNVKGLSAGLSSLRHMSRTSQ